MPAGSVSEDVDLRPASINYFNATQGNPVTHYQPELDIPSAQAHRMDLKSDVMRAFFADLFNAVTTSDDKNKTATEINAIKAEKAQALTPIINRLYDEFFSPSIVRTLELLMENGIVPPVPEALEGQDYTVEYTTRMTALLKQVESLSAISAFQQSAGIFQVQNEVPQISEIVNVDKMVKGIFEAQSVDTDIIYSEKETEDIRKAKAEEMQARQQAQMAMEKTAPVDLSSKPEEGSPLQQMIEQGGGMPVQ